MTTILNIIYKLSTAINIITSPSCIKGIKTVINIFTFMLSCSVPYLNRLK